MLIMLQLRIVIRQTLQSGHWPHHRKVIPAGTTPPYARLVATHIHLGGPGLLRQAGLQPHLILDLLLGTKFKAALVAAITGADAVLIVVHWREVAIVAEHGIELTQAGRGRHMAHLTAHRIERQLGKGDERRQLVSGGNHQIGGLPAASVTTLDLPAIHLFGNGNHLGVEYHLKQPAGLCFLDCCAGEIRRAEPAPPAGS